MKDPVAGSTVYWMDDGADTGPIEAQNWRHVLPGETARDLWQRALASMSIELITDVVLRLLISETPMASLRMNAWPHSSRRLPVTR